MNPTVEIREAKKRKFKSESDEPLRVCAYCRVSTDEQDQRNSLQSQQRFFEKVFADHPKWTNVGIFADEGISGTSLNKRDEFNKMIALAKRHGVDLIYTKEVSRFSRNVRDTISIAEELRLIGVYIIFLSDDINTEDPAHYEQLPQSATNAQYESLKTSRRVRWGQRQQMENGVVFGRKEMFGYRIERDSNGVQHFVVIEEEARIVKQIFEWFAAGYGTYRISNFLMEKGVKTMRYKNGWSATVILRILRNEKYVGDLLQGKTYTPEPLSHKKKYNNNSESPQFYIRDHHPNEAIISRDLWDKVQRILQDNEPSPEQKAKHSRRYWTSGKVFCGLCGGRYVHLHKKLKYSNYLAWVCFEAHQHGAKKEAQFDEEVAIVGCNNKQVNDKVLRAAVHDIVKELLPNREKIYQDLLNEVKELTSTPKVKEKEVNYDAVIKKKQNEIIDLTEKYNQGKIPEFAYLPTVNKINVEINELQTKQIEVDQQTEKSSRALEKFKDISAEIEKLVNLTDEDINDELFERITKKIVIYPDKILEVHLSFTLRPIYMQYETHGRGDAYSVFFTILNEAEFREKIASYNDKVKRLADK